MQEIIAKISHHITHLLLQLSAMEGHLPAKHTSNTRTTDNPFTNAPDDTKERLQEKLRTLREARTRLENLL